MSSFPSYSSAKMLTEFQSEDIEIILIYSNKTGIRSPNVKKLDLLLHHFANDIRIASDKELSELDVQSATHLVYYGEDELVLNKQVISVIDQFSGPVIGIGENISQLTSFAELEIQDTIHIKAVDNQWGYKLADLSQPVSMKPIIETKDMNVLLYGNRGQKQHPLFTQFGNHFYFGAVEIEAEFKYLLGEVLHDVIPNNHENEHLAYIRLEDIHPMSDPEKVLEVGEYLNEREIPFILVVFPVYITPDTGERVYFSSSPELVSVLQYLQDTGGTVISHGYTHQYRDSESGEGFEFWDVENDQMIIEPNPHNEIEIIRDRDSFSNKEDYEKYLKPLLEKEKQYIETRLEKSVHELLKYELYPVAFEATMSDQGYTIASNYFSTIFGQLQYTSDKWGIMGTSPYITTPTDLKGMKLLPETFGYVDTSVEHPFEKNERRLKNLLLVRDGIIGGSYHPYLGLEYLEDFLAIYENIPNLKWIDLKMQSHWVETSKASIFTDGSGTINVSNDLSWWDHWKRHNEHSAFENVLWIVTIVVLIFICLFIVFTLYLRTQLKKRLFLERK